MVIILDLKRGKEPFKNKYPVLVEICINDMFFLLFFKKCSVCSSINKCLV